MSRRPWFRCRPPRSAFRETLVDYFWGAIIIGLLFLCGVIIWTAPAHPAERCVASWYSQGRYTASGERFNRMALTAAHRTAPFGSWIGVRAYGRSIHVRVNDRGPSAATGRCIDLAEGAAIALRIKGRGTALVELEMLR